MVTLRPELASHVMFQEDGAISLRSGVMPGYTQGDAAKDTNVKESEAAAAHHDARTDSGVREAESGERGAQEAATKGNQAEAQATESTFGLPNS
jgi:hypothetical protein